MRRSLLALSVCLLMVSPVLAQSESVAADEQVVRAANLPTDGPGLLDFFRKRSLRANDQDRIQTLIRELGDDSFQVREKASAQLVALGSAALPALQQAVKDPDIEVVRRAEDCLRRIKTGVASAVVAAAARLLADRKPEGAAEVLLDYLPSADDEQVADAVRDALGTVAVRDGKADPAVVAALADKSPVRRAAAAEVLARGNVSEHLPAVRKLLNDSDAQVRLRAALALAAQKEKEAVPVLINLLAELPANRAWQAEDLLFRLAEDRAPTEASGTDDAGRKKYRDAWLDWWNKHGATTDLAKLEGPPKQLGYTLVVLLDAGRLVDLDEKNRPRWQIDQLQFPLDVQLLPGERALIAEHNANRVTERSKQGQILWEHKIDGPLVAQRLPGGNTFIATRERLVEVDRDGKEVFAWASPRGEQIMRAQKLRNGDIGCVLTSLATRYVQLDPGGRERHTFPVDIRTSGGRIDVLPNGRVLVPLMASNKIVEYDNQGRVVWEATVEQPVAAVRLPNGHTLVTSMNQQRAIELDRTGKEVWEYRTDTRVTRAWRR